MTLLDELLADLREVFATFPDNRKGEVTYGMADVGMAGFSAFFMQSPSFLAHQRLLQEEIDASNCDTLFGMDKIPTNARIRQILDEVEPWHLRPCFDQMLAALRSRGGLSAFLRLGGRSCIALDGSEYFCSQKICCANCLTRERSNEKKGKRSKKKKASKRSKNKKKTTTTTTEQTTTTEFYHAMVVATIVAPGHNKAFPLYPEYIVTQDGAEKQDCERNGAKRWLANNCLLLQDLRPIFLGDDLYACQSICETVLQNGADFLFTAKPESHKTLYEFVEGAECEELSEPRNVPGKKRIHHYRWLRGVPIRDGEDAIEVTWIGLIITDAEGETTYTNQFVTSLDVTAENVGEIADCARARWKIENESFNVLKNCGYHLEHNFGHGKKNLSMLLAGMNLLAFAMHTVCDCVEPLWQEARKAKGARKRFFEHIRVATGIMVFPDWEALLTSACGRRVFPARPFIITAQPP